MQAGTTTTRGSPTEAPSTAAANKSSDLPVGAFYRQNLVQGKQQDGSLTDGCGGDPDAPTGRRRRVSLNNSGSNRSAATPTNSMNETEKDSELMSNASNRTTDGQTMMHILKANIGTGVLALPLAFKNVGLWLGLVLVPVIGFICIHCMNILISSHNNLCDRFNYESLDYDQVASLGLACGPRWARRFAKKASIIVTIFLMLTQIGFCCVYILFTVENLQVACMNLFGLNYSMLTYLLAIFPVIGLTSCTSNLKHLARISTLANALQLLGLTLIFYDLLQFRTYAAVGAGSSSEATIEGAGAGAGEAPSTPVRPHIVVEQGFSSNIASGLPLFFATAVYAFEGIGVVLPLVKEMQRPARISGLNGVLNTSMALVALLYMAMGFFGYAKYGQTVAGSITLNLPESTLNEIVRLAFALAIGLSYGLQFYIPWAYFWPLIDEALFYSYRPRVPRDKLTILDKLSAENHWAITKVLQEQEQEDEAAAEAEAERRRQLEDASGRHENSTSNSTAFGNSKTANYENSMATTMATSYSMSMSTNFNPFAHQTHGKAPLMSGHIGAASALSGNQQQQPSQYGTLDAINNNDLLSGGQARLRQQQQQQSTMASTTTTTKRLRNRFEDVIEQSADVDSMMPEVQWRPPPRSMRGKRKLVRYTVILLTVSFTFVAAALIPRLDLFISLIGALASSCLAIIFPAIIQLCTFWNYNKSSLSGGGSGQRHDSDDDEDDDDDDDESARQQVASGAAALAEASSSTSQLLLSQEQKKKTKRKCSGKRKRKWLRSLAWQLFLLKNLFLVVFGCLGLITGTWVSLRQLSAVGDQV